MPADQIESGCDSPHERWWDLGRSGSSGDDRSEETGAEQSRLWGGLGQTSILISATGVFLGLSELKQFLFSHLFHLPPIIF